MLPNTRSLISTVHHHIPTGWLRLAGYILRRLTAILLTILVGVFIIVIIANRSGQLDEAARADVNRQVITLSRSAGYEGDLEAERRRLETWSGMGLPFWPRHLLYTLRVLRLDWGDALDGSRFSIWIDTGSGGLDTTTNSRLIILSHLPNTLLLSGTAFLLLTLLGIPLALYLSQHESGLLDRLMGLLTPLSSIPSWVIGILLVLVFSFQVYWFPPGKMYNAIPPQTPWETVRVVAWHMVLPVTAIVLSMFFQLVNAWRTYLLIYTDEDYVDLARAKGLPPRAINARYILWPASPYIVTNLVITLVGFWQMTTALEFFFQWPGIGKLFVDAIPNFNAESMYPGEMSIVIGLVVLFAYLLGLSVFIMDFMYVLLDPRMRQGPQTEPGLVRARPRHADRRWGGWLKHLRDRPKIAFSPRSALFGVGEAWRQAFWGLAEGLADALRVVWQAPSGKVGLLLIAALLLASGLVLIFVPYDPLVKGWDASGFERWNPTTARMALPVWANWLRSDDLPATITLDSSQAVQTSNRAWDAAASSSAKHLEFVFDYPYSHFPSEVTLYLESQYHQKKPFVALSWVTPDGREISLRSSSVSKQEAYHFEDNVPVRPILRKNEHFRAWFDPTSSQAPAQYTLLFADPRLGKAGVLPGQYRLRIDAMMFEPDSTLDAQLVVFGEVEGWAGSDYLRRNLLIPLLWGLPLALIVGVLGALLTSLLALILAAAAAWLGGWVDALIQAAIEVNMILPVMAVSVLLYAFYQFSLWSIVALIILSTVLGSSVKSFRAAFLKEKSAGYVEAAMAYGASDWRIITHYLVRRIAPILAPEVVLLIPKFIFLEATLAIFNISDVHYPTWGRILYAALRNGALFGSRFWVLEPLALMLVTCLAFVLLGAALNRVLIPRLNGE